MSREWYPESVFLTKVPEHHGFDVRPFDESKNKHSDIKRIVSDKKKLFYDNRQAYGHLLTLWLDVILKELSLTEEKFTILFLQKSTARHQIIENTSGLTEYLEKRFTDLGHEVEYIDSDCVIVDNLIFTLPEHNNSISSISRVITFLSHGLDYSSAPHKKIYLSRGKTTTFNGNPYVSIPRNFSGDPVEIDDLRKNNQYKFSNRIDDEKTVEDYFISLGFTVIYPEDIQSFEEQLKLIASCKTVASITSSSLTTCFVMAPNTSVVELSTPLENGSPISIDNSGFDVHNHYKMFSDVGGKNYLSIPHNRIALDLINSIESNPTVKSFLLS
jgi:hypothetical protein